jgi:hypothetical protein
VNRVRDNIESSRVATLTTDTKTIANPTWVDVEREIIAVDGRQQTLVMLSPVTPDGDHHMAIGGSGGGGDQFIVYVTEDNLKFWNLTDPNRRGAEHKVRMKIGGQEGEYRAAQLVPREMALSAARRYVEDGGRAPELAWERSVPA